jgi:hypothetical protein
MEMEQDPPCAPVGEPSESQLAHITGGAGEATAEDVKRIFDDVYKQGTAYATRQAEHKGVSIVDRALGSIPRTATAFGALTAGQVVGRDITKKKGQ